MELDGEDEAVVRFQPLHGAVLSMRGLLQSGRKGSDCLVVEAVDADLVLARRSPQLGIGIDLDGVGEVAAPQRAHLVALEVLNQRAAHCDVDHLLAAADTEHGQLALAGLAEHRQLGFIKLGVGVSDLLVPLLPVKGRVDIPASWEQEPVDVWERLGPRDQAHGLGAGSRDRPAVGREILEAPPRVDRDPYSRLFGHELNDQSPAAPAAATAPGAASSASVLAHSSVVPWTFGALTPL